MSDYKCNIGSCKHSDASDDDMDISTGKRLCDGDSDSTPPAKRVKLAQPAPSPSAEMDARLDLEIEDALAEQRDIIRGRTPDYPDHPRWTFDVSEWDTPFYDRAVQAWQTQIMNLENSRM